jgi:integrase
MTSAEPTLSDDDTAELVPALVEHGGGGVAPAGRADRAGSRLRPQLEGDQHAAGLRVGPAPLRQLVRGVRPLHTFPAEPETVALYLVDHAERLAVSTLRRRLAAISEAHQAARFPNPTIDPAVRITWAGIRRTHGKARDAKEAAVTEVVAAMVAPLGGRLIDVRDRAILLLGFAGALRRSELSALDVDDVVEMGEGLKIAVARSKTDQEGEGHTVGIT